VKTGVVMPKTEPMLEEQLIDHLFATGYDDLDTETVRACKRLIMDALGVTFPGSRAPGCPELLQLMASWKSGSGASVLLHGFQIAPPLAALANSAMMHALDFDDTLDASALHALVTVLPAALAAAEVAGGVDGKAFVAAVVLGVDIVCRISLGIRRPLSWIRTATCGSFGAAAAAGKILGLDRDALFDALGVVYSQTSGNAQGLLEGRLVKRMQPGFAASGGVTSACLAAKGITGSRAFLTGPYGYYRLYERDDFDVDPVTADLGRKFSIVGLSIKPYPCCRMTHASIDAALSIRDRIGTVGSIEAIEVSVSRMVMEMVGKPLTIGKNPQVDAQFSIPYTVACALARGDVFLGDFETEAIRDPELRALAGKVRVSVEPSLPDNDILQSQLQVYGSGGSPVQTRVSVPLGNPLRPMTDAQCRKKFEKCLDYSGIGIDTHGRKRLLSTIENLDALPDVRDLISQMNG
jgi:2-methylcitrate dehydratase PrpD